MPMRRSPYASIRWKRLRLEILQRDGRQCQLRGPRCRGRADSVHHIIPVSQGGAFFDPENLQASCTPCNTAGGAQITNDGRRWNRERIVELEHVVAVQEARIEELADALARHLNGPATEPARTGRKPAIY